MGTKIFVNLPIKDLKKTMGFFTKLGFTFNKQFTNDKAACMVISEENYVMLLLETFFKDFTKKEIPDTAKSSEVILALSYESREKVDEILKKVLKAGGKEYGKQDYGWMYSRGFQDINGHLWEVFWMDPNKVEKQ